MMMVDHGTDGKAEARPCRREENLGEGDFI